MAFAPKLRTTLGRAMDLSTTTHTGSKRRHRYRAFLALLISLFVLGQTGCKAQGWDQWDKYSQRFVNDEGRVIDRQAQDRTTSEGESYALFFALVANDKPRFDKLLKWSEANLANGDLTLRLPAWNWGKAPDGTWKILDDNPAADADLWMAYSLMEAGRLWHNDRYAKLGSTMALRIAQQETVDIPGLGVSLLPGPKGFHQTANTWILNPSYLPPFLLTYFAKAQPQGPWNQILNSLKILLSRGSGDGYVMDWVSAGDSVQPSLSPTQLATGKTENLVPVGSYDAIRVYLWLGMTDPGTSGIRDLLHSTTGMSSYLKTAVTPPLIVDVTGKIVNADGRVGFSAAVIPYLHLVGYKDQEKAQDDRLGAVKDDATGLYGRDATYYDQNLALFATGWSDQHFHFDRDGKLKVKWK